MNTWLAPAKLNLFLHIIGTRADGFHLLQSVIQFIDLCDELKFKLRSDEKIKLNCTDASLLKDDNLVLRAANILQKSTACKQGADISLNKIIPTGAGLGGGSSNAATTFLALNRLWNCELKSSQLEALGQQLGTDIPIFIRARACMVEGTGEKLEPIELSEPWYVVVYPNIDLDTKTMYANADLMRNCTPIKIRDFAQQATQNVFEPIARKQPEIERAFQWLNEYSTARLTGSGSALFAVCTSEQEAHNIANNCPTEFVAFVVKGMNRSPVASLYE